MSTKTFASSRKKLVFCPQNDQILPEIGIFGHFGHVLSCSSGALLVGWLMERAVSRKTPIYFMMLLLLL